MNILQLPLFYTDNFKIFKNALGQFILNHPPKHVLTSTNSTLIIIRDQIINLTSNDIPYQIVIRDLIASRQLISNSASNSKSRWNINSTSNSNLKSNSNLRLKLRSWKRMLYLTEKRTALMGFRILWTLLKKTVK